MKQVWYIHSNDVKNGTPVFANKGFVVFADQEHGYPLCVSRNDSFQTYPEALAEFAKRVGNQINILNSQLSKSFAELSKQAAIVVDKPAR